MLKRLCGDRAAFEAPPPTDVEGGGVQDRQTDRC